MADSKCRPLYCVCGFTFPQRLLIIILTLVGFFLTRIYKSDITFGDGQYLTRDSPESENDSISSDKALKALESTTAGTVTYAIRKLGHFIGVIPAGILTDKFGAKWFYFGGVTLSAIITLFTPLLLESRAHWTIVGLFRFILGFAHSVVLPCVAVVVVRWVPFTERGVLGAFTFSSLVFLSYTGDNILLFHGSSEVWSTLYYTSGVLGLCWCSLWAVLAYEKHSKHPRITTGEKDYLDDQIPHDSKLKWSCRQAMNQKGVWALILGQMGQDVLLFFLQRMLEKKEEPLKEELFMCITLVLWLVGIISGFIADYGINKKDWSIKWTRRISTTIAVGISCIFMCTTAFTGDDLNAKRALLGAAIISLGPMYAGHRVNHMDVTINFVGALIGVLVFSADLMQFLCFILYGFVIKDEKKFVWVLFGSNIVFGLCYLLMAEEDRAEWDYPPYDEDE